MSRMWRQGAAVLAAAVWLGSAGPAARAAFVFSFERPNFNAGDSGVLANRSPDGGGGGFAATFGPQQGIGFFSINSFENSGIPAPFDRLNGLFDGQYLSGSNIGAGFGPNLVVTFSQAITGLTVDFAINNFTGVGGSNGGRLTLLAAGNPTVTVASSNVGGGLGFPGGTLTATFATPVNQVFIRALAPAPPGVPEFRQVDFALDNLRVSPLPAPPAVAMALMGLVSAGGFARLRRQARA